MVCRTTEEAVRAVDQIMVDRAFGEAGSQVVIEECLWEKRPRALLSRMEKRFFPWLPARTTRLSMMETEDRTPADGAYSPAPVVTAEIHEKVSQEVLHPIVKGMAQEGIPYKVSCTLESWSVKECRRCWSLTPGSGTRRPSRS